MQNLIGGAGNDTFKLSDNVGVSGIINGNGGTNTLNYSLYAATHPITYNLATGAATNITGGASHIQSFVGGTSASDTLIGANTNTTWTITAVNAGTAGAFAFSSIENLTGGSAADVFNFSGGFSIGGALNGGGGANTLIGPNLAKTWTITATNRGNLPGVVSSFTNIQSLTGGSAQDIFVFANGAAMAGTIDGGAGNNWLNYAAWTSSLTINLQTGANSAAGGGTVDFNNILGSAAGGDNITGSAAGGVLVAHNANNFISGGLGRSLIIGGFGKNIVFGGNSDDLIINGNTSYDNNIAVLQNILTIWQSSTLTYAQRLTALQASGPDQLKVGTTVFLAPSQGSIGPRFGRGNTLYESTLEGSGGQDWFFSGTLTSVVDKATNETVTSS